jgi:hypothetical protein
VGNSRSVVYEERSARLDEERRPVWLDIFVLLMWMVAGSVTFLPFAVDTSAWDAVTLRVPGNQGNWWHALVGAPFFLAFPMIWLRLRALFSAQVSTARGRRVLWVVVGLAIVATVLVQAPFLLHLAGTSEWQRLTVVSIGLGIVVASGIALLSRRRRLSPTTACMAGTQHGVSRERGTVPGGL